MTRAESVVLALEACVKAGRPVSSDWYGNDSELLHQFATMVAAAERKAIHDDAVWCVNNYIEHLIPERIRARGNDDSPARHS